MNIRVPINSEQMGSAMNQPNCSIKTDDTITPTLPMASAKTCKNTPENGSKNYSSSKNNSKKKNGTIFRHKVCS